MKQEVFEPGNYYHVFNRGNNKENIFKEEENYFYFLKLIEKYLTPAIKFMQMGEYDDWETKKLVRIYEDCESRFNNLLSESVATDKYRFYQFTKQYDARRGKNFTEVFPEFKDFLKEYENK